jgi:hypothetical protein
VSRIKAGLTLLSIATAVIALATFMIVASINAGRADILTLAGFQPDERLVEVEYCEHEDVFDFVLGGEEAGSGQVRFPTYLLAGPEHENTIGKVESALRHCRKPRRRPALALPSSCA